MQKPNHTPLLFRLRKLLTSKTVLHVGAHPDDEEIGLLSYISFKHYGRAVYFSATRGESGQNIINNYKGPALGVYRTWESMNVRVGDGGECLFGPFIDFGFSKTPDEAFIKWGKKHVIRELVRAIRLVQPQVIISRWSGTADDGHGHHQAVGQALPAAIEAAGNPDMFPELMSLGLFPWNAVKVYLSTNKNPYPRGELNEGLENDCFLRINTGEYSPLLGCTYQEQAWMAYGRHQTQGMEVIPAPGDFYYYLKLFRSGLDAPLRDVDLFYGIETGLKGMLSGVGEIQAEILTSLEEIEGLLFDAKEKYAPENPVLSCPPLLDGLALLKRLQADIRKMKTPGMEMQAAAFAIERKIREIEEAATLCLGFRLESYCTRAKATPGESVWINSRLWNFLNTPIDKVSFSVNAPMAWRIDNAYDSGTLNGSSNFMEMSEAFIGEDAELSCPYWLKGLKKGFIYDHPDEALSLQPLSPGFLSAECTVSLGSHEIRLFAPTLNRKAFPGGYRELPPFVVPPISLHPEFDKRIFLASPSGHKFTFQVTARCNDEERPADGRLELIGPAGWHISPTFTDITLPPVNGAATRSFEVTIPPATPEGRYLLRFNIRCRGRDYGVILTPVRMGALGLPNPDDPATCIMEELILTPAQAEIFIVDARLKEGRRYGYIEGAKEESLSILKSLGMNIHGLQDAEIAHGDLNSYDAIIAGPNAYLIRRTLAENAHRLLEYVENGGVLIVLYHTYEFQGGGYAPYPFAYSRPHDRVTDENAHVAMLTPENPLFHYPNKITAKDFENWVHDRGLYFFGRWDERYTPLLSCADAGEIQKKGGLMCCEYGKGAYLYVGYSLSRQLPAGVSGAFRLFFNMLCLKASTGEAL